MSDTLKSYEEQKAMRGEAVDTCKTCRHKLEPGDEMILPETHCDACHNFDGHAPKDVCQYCWGRGCHFCGEPSEDPDEIEREARNYDKIVELFEGTSDANGPHSTGYHEGVSSDIPTATEAAMQPMVDRLKELDIEYAPIKFPYDAENHQLSVEGIKDSGTRTEFETGAVRDARGNKGRFDLLPIMTLFRLAKHYERGCLKYGDRNWEKGIPISKYIDSAIRHLLKHVCGFTDEHHLTSALWNIAGCMETLDRIELGLLPDSLDDMPCTFADVDYERFEEILDKLL